MRHDFLDAQIPDDGTEHLWHGYPDECFAFMSFVDSLVALILYGGWGIQPPISVVRKALIIDFASKRQSEAEASLAHGWAASWEFPDGVTTTVQSRVEVNEQNSKLGRHLTLVGSSMTQEDFFHAVGEKLLDVHSCQDKSCTVCKTRATRGLADVFQILASGTKESEVQLFARWTPNDDLIEPLRADGISIVARALDDIPAEDLEANRYFHNWSGRENQRHEFREAVWAPDWKKNDSVAGQIDKKSSENRIDCSHVGCNKEGRHTVQHVNDRQPVRY